MYQSVNRIRFLISCFAMVVLLATIGCAGSGKTASTLAGSRAAPAATSFAGTWEGPFEAMEFSGRMKLTLKSEGDNWIGTLEASAMGESDSGIVENFKIEGNGFTLQTFISGADVVMKGKLVEGKISGSFQVFDESYNMLDEGTFSMTRQ